MSLPAADVEISSTMSARACGVIAASFLTIAIAYTVRYGYGMLLPGMLSALTISKAEAGIISASYFVAYTLFSPLVGALSDRVNPRILISAFTAVLALGTVLMGYAHSLLAAALCFGLVGIGHAACWAPVVSQVQIWVGEQHRGTALAVATMGSSFGIAAWSMVLPSVVGRAGYQGGWWLLGAVGFLVSLVNWMLFRRKDAELGEQGGKGSSEDVPEFRALYRVLLKNRRVWLVGCSYCCIGFTVLVPFTFLSVYMTEELGYGLTAASRCFTVIAVAAVVGKLVLGILSDRLGRMGMMSACGILLAVGCGSLVHFDGLAPRYLAVIAIGMGFGAVWPLYAAAAVDLFPRSQAGSVIGLWTVFLGVGSVASPIICGWLIDLAGSHMTAFSLACATGVLAVLLLIPVWK